jgi:uncharacterized protein
MAIDQGAAVTDPTSHEPQDWQTPSEPGHLPHDPAYGATPPPYPPPPYGAPQPPYGTTTPYGAPAPYGTQQPYGAPVPYGHPQAGVSGNDDTTWAMLGYLGQFVVGFLAPLVVYMSRKDQSPFCRFHGAQGLNIAITNHIVFAVGIVFSIVTLGIGLIIALPLMLVYGITGLVYLIMAAVKANQGEMYVIPKWLAWRFVK